MTVHSSSRLPADIERAYELGASSYLVKDVGLAEMTQRARGIAVQCALLTRSA